MVHAVRHYNLMRLSCLRSLRSRKYLIITGLVPVLIISGYMLWSKQVWEQYTPSYAQWQQDVKLNIKTITTLPTTNSTEQDVLLKRLESVSHRITSEQSSICDITALVKWQQQFILKYGNAQIACHKRTADIVSFQKQLDVMIAYLKNDQELAKIAITVTPSAEISDDAWENQVAGWSEAIDATKNLSVSATFEPTRQRAVERMSAVKVAWQEIIAAHQLKDKAKYIAAQDKLGVGYDGLNDIVVDSKKNLADLSSSLNNAYVRSFK